MNRHLRKKPVWWAATLLLLIVASFIACGERLLWVHTDHPLKQADAVAVLAGAASEDRQRIKKAIALWQQKKAMYLILPWRHPAITWPWVVDTYGLTSAPPKYAVLIGRSGDSEAQTLARYGGTYVEAQQTVKLMHHHGLRSAVIVSSGYHMRRVAMAFDHLGRDDGLTFFYHAVGAPSWSWWFHKNQIRQITNEYKKLILAFFLYPTAGRK